MTYPCTFRLVTSLRFAVSIEMRFSDRRKLVLKVQLHIANWLQEVKGHRDTSELRRRHIFIVYRIV